MRKNILMGIAVFVMLSLIVVACNPQPPGPELASRERISIDARDDAYLYQGADLKFYSDDHSTLTGNIDGQYGSLYMAAPTGIPTATPAAVIDSAGVSNLLEVRDGGTAVLSINNGGAYTFTGAGTYSSGQTVNSWAKASAPTAIATATPALVVDTLGVSNIAEFRQAATPVAYINSSGIAADTVSELTSANGVAVDGVTLKDGGATFTALLTTVVDVENFGLPSVISTTVAYGSATGTVATIADGEIWIVHDVLVNVTANFNCTGDDCSFTVGDGNDADGFIVLADAELQAADTEFTGAAAGWQGLSAATRGVYLDEVTTNSAHRFIYAPSGAAETIDWVVGGTDPAAGSLDVYVIYTRIK